MRRTLLAASLICTACAAAQVRADDDAYRAASEWQASPASMTLDVGKDYALGLTKYRLDHETEVLGWQVSDSVYFGRQRGEDSGLTLVWQQENNQVSLSKDGIRLTRRF